jgi:hypothetical protein
MFTSQPVPPKCQSKIAVYFDRSTPLISRFKKLKEAKWSASLKVWHPSYRQQFMILPKVPAGIALVNEYVLPKIAQYFLVRHRY